MGAQNISIVHISVSVDHDRSVRPAEQTAPDAGPKPPTSAVRVRGLKALEAFKLGETVSDGDAFALAAILQGLSQAEIESVIATDRLDSETHHPTSAKAGLTSGLQPPASPSPPSA